MANGDGDIDEHQYLTGGYDADGQGDHLAHHIEGYSHGGGDSLPIRLRLGRSKYKLGISPRQT